MSFGIGNILGLAGDAAGIIGTGGMDPMAWMGAVDQVTGSSSSGGGLEGMLGGLLGGGDSSDQASQTMAQIFSQLGVSMIQDSTG